MRIISGKARGTKLYTLEGKNTRPTLDRVKESIFNIIQNDLLNCTFLDLFSGSGAIGLEASSRGAKKVYLCEKEKEAIRIIRKNIEKTHLRDSVILYEMDFTNVLQTKIKETLDFIYIDPPYESDFIEKALVILIKKEYVTSETKIIIETDQEIKILEMLKEMPVNIKDQRRYGRASVIFIQKQETTFNYGKG